MFHYVSVGCWFILPGLDDSPWPLGPLGLRSQVAWVTRAWWVIPHGSVDRSWPFVPWNFGVDGEKSVWDIGTLCGLIYFCWTDLLFLYFIFGGWALRVTFGHKTKLSGYCVQLVFWFSLSFRIALFCTRGCISKNWIRHLTVHPEFLTGLLKCFDLQCNLQSGD